MQSWLIQQAGKRLVLLEQKAEEARASRPYFSEAVILDAIGTCTGVPEERSPRDSQHRLLQPLAPGMVPPSPPGPLWLQRPAVGPRTRKRWRLLYTRTRSYDTLHWSQGTPAHCLSISYGATDEPRWEPLPDLRLPVESKKGFAEVASKQNIGIFEEEDAMMSKRWPGHRLPATAMHHTPYGAPRTCERPQRITWKRH